MARELSQILSELDASYNPQRQTINDRLSLLPEQADAEIKGLESQKTQAFDDILAGARNRGMGFSGIPLAEEAKYVSSSFLPAVARVKQSQNETKLSLIDALNNINLSQNQYAQSVRQQELDRDEQIRQFNEQLAAQKAAAAAAIASPTLGYGGGGSASIAKAEKREDGGFNFRDANGNSISAANYSQLSGIPFRQLLQYMSDEGDAGAKAALDWVGDDYNYDTGKAVNPGIYNALTWGIRPNYSARGAGSGGGGGGGGGW